jgi:hypothetical protein
MTYDEKLAIRIRESLKGKRNITEKKMFGGLAFLLGSKMFCGIINDDLVVRTGPQNYEKALARPHARKMDFTGRPMKGFVYVGPTGYKTSKGLSEWICLGMDYALTLKK